MSLTATELAHLLSLIEEAHLATSVQSLRENLVYGVGALIDSVSCVWTELDTGLFEANTATTTAVDIYDEHIDREAAIKVFNQYAWQHLVIAHVISTKEQAALSISDFLSRAQFNQKELYQLFYLPQSIEDQLSIGYIEKGSVKGISINRASWGFTESERQMLTYIARCVFPFYRILQQVQGDATSPRSIVEANESTIVLHRDVLGLTSREADVLQHVASGKSNKQIAEACCISEGTVRKHLENSYRQLGVNNRISAITKSMEILKIIGR